MKNSHKNIGTKRNNKTVKGGENMRSKISILTLGMILIGASAFGQGGVIPDGQGTNWAFGDIKGNTGTEWLRDILVPWASIQDTPTTLSGYGITDALGTNVTDRVVFEGGVEVQDTFTLTPSDVQTITNTAAITIDAPVVKVIGDDGGGVTPTAVTDVTIGSGTQAGQQLTILGTSDTGTVELTGVTPNFMMGENDVINFMWSGSAWIEQFRRDN